MPKSKQKSIATEIQELRVMPVPDLVDRYETVFGKPPRVKHKDWLWRRIAWKIQEQRFGGLSEVAKKRLDELIAELDLPLGGGQTMRGAVGSGKAMAGTTLTRTWKGREIQATSTDQGWEYDGVVYRSLSAVVKAITGSHASGPAWFGLKKRKAAR